MYLYIVHLPSFLFLLVCVFVALPLVAGRAHERVARGVVARAPLGVERAALHEARRNAERVAQPRVLRLLRLRDRVRLANAAHTHTPVLARRARAT